MGECNDCKVTEKKKTNELMPNIIINITYNDCRVEEDNSNYIDNVSMEE